MMEIKSAEVQELLLKLTQTLKPLAEEGDFIRKGDVETSLALTRRIFSPTSPYKSFSDNSEVRILPNLQTAREKIKQWMQTGEKPKEMKISFGKSSATPKAPPSPESPISLAHQARYVLAQVRVAIQMLSSYSNLDKPEEKVLRDAIGRLKPYVDELIEAVERKEMGSSENRTPPSLMRPLPKSPREHLFKKTLPLPAFKEKTEKQPLPKVSHLPTEKDPIPSGKNPSQKTSLEDKEQKLPMSSKFLLSPEEKTLLSTSEKTSIMGAPLLPEKPLPQKRFKKKKKKEQQLWSDPEELDKR